MEPKIKPLMIINHWVQIYFQENMEDITLTNIQCRIYDSYLFNLCLNKRINPSFKINILVFKFSLRYSIISIDVETSSSLVISLISF